MVPAVGLEPRIEDLTRFATLRLNHSGTQLEFHSTKVLLPTVKLKAKNIVVMLLLKMFTITCKPASVSR